MHLPLTCESGGIGRRARFRFLCPQGCGGSSPPFRTTLTSFFEGVRLPVGGCSRAGRAASHRCQRVVVGRSYPFANSLSFQARPRPHVAATGVIESPLSHHTYFILRGVSATARWGLLARRARGLPPLPASGRRPIQPRRQLTLIRGSATTTHRCHRRDRVPPFAPHFLHCSRVSDCPLGVARAQGARPPTAASEWSLADSIPSPTHFHPGSATTTHRCHRRDRVPPFAPHFLHSSRVSICPLGVARAQGARPPTVASEWSLAESTPSPTHFHPRLGHDHISLPPA